MRALLCLLFGIHEWWYYLECYTGSKRQCRHCLKWQTSSHNYENWR